MSAKVSDLTGIDVDVRAVERATRIFQGHPRVTKVVTYDGRHIPFADKQFDVVTCVEVIEHVEDYKCLLLEVARVAKRLVFITTPNRRPENTLPNGRPKNYWHLREWSKSELDAVLAELGLECEWNFLSETKQAFTWTTRLREDTTSLVPVVRPRNPQVTAVLWVS